MGDHICEEFANHNYDYYYDDDYYDDFYDPVATVSSGLSGSFKVGGKFKTCRFKIEIHC